MKPPTHYCPVNGGGGECDGAETTLDGLYVLMLDPNERIQDPGDSGGPWVRPDGASGPTTIYGIHAGGSNRRNPQWENSWNASFTKAHWLDDAPVSIRPLTSSPPRCAGLNVTHWGTGASETIWDTGGRDVIHGGGGGDTIHGLGGNDVICGGGGNDTIHAGAGNDRVYGQDGTDTIYAGGGTDHCNGGPGSDYATYCETIAGIERGLGTFFDDDASVHRADIEWIAARDITRGCNPPANTAFCPKRDVTRRQMAGFLYNWYRGRPHFSNPPASYDPFTDDGNNPAIEWMAYNKISLGCNPKEGNTRFCPDRVVDRGEMAVFLTRVYRRARGLPMDSGLPTTRSFTDVTTQSFAPHVEYIKNLRVTLGCNPPDNTRYCPGSDTTREQMASFLKRLLD